MAFGVLRLAFLALFLALFLRFAFGVKKNLNEIAFCVWRSSAFAVAPIPAPTEGTI